jgi:hypothetical protein
MRIAINQTSLVLFLNILFLALILKYLLDHDKLGQTEQLYILI